MKYGFEREYDAIVRKNKRDELTFLRKKVTHLVNALPKSNYDKLKKFFPNDTMTMGKKDLINIGELVERTLREYDPLYLKAVEADDI